MNLPPGTTADDAVKFVRYLASHAHSQEMHFHWRPILADADDDMVLKLAWLTQCQHIITRNQADFRAAEQLGVTPRSP